MKRLFIIAFLFISSILNGQETIDSIQIKLADTLFQQAGEIFNFHQDSSIVLIREASSLYKKTNTSGKYIKCLNSLTNIYHFRNEFENYKNASENAVKEAVSRLSSNHSEYASALSNQISYNITLGDFENGISQLKTVLKIYKENNESSFKLATAYHNIGSLYVKNGDYPQAIEYHTQALNLRQDTLVKSLNLRHDTLNLNRIAEFQYLFNQSKQAIAWASYKNKGYDIALEHFESSLTALKKIKGNKSKLITKLIITALQSIAKIHQVKGNTDLAYQYVRKAIQYQSQKNDFRKAHSLEILGQLDLEQNKLTSAAINFEKALSIFEQQSKTKTLQDYARKLTSLAQVKEQTGALDEAVIYLQKALHVLAPGFNDDHGNPSEKMLFSKLDALDILKNKGDVLWTKYQKTNEQSTLELAYDVYQSGVEVIKAIRQGVVTKEAKNILAEKTVSIYEGAIQSVLKLHEITKNESFLFEAFSLAENSKSMLLLEAMNEQAALGIKGLPDSLIQRDKELRLEISFFQRQLIESTQKQKTVDSLKVKKIKKQLFDSKGALSQLTDFFEETYPRFYQLKYQNETSSIAECQQFLSIKNQALIEYFYGEENIYGFVVWANGFDYFQVNQHQDVTEAIEKLRTSISSVPKEQDVLQNHNDFTSTASYLFQTILAPALKHLPDNIQSLKIIPDDQLSYIPFDLLLLEKPISKQPYFDTDYMEYVLEKYAIGYEYSVALMLKNDRKNQQNSKYNFLAYAPSFQKATTQESTRSCQGELYDLSCNKKEVDEINQLMNGTAYLENSALKSSFEAEAADFRIIHMATHACVDENNPLFNKIFLSDDYLSNADLYNTELTAELVVLSACNTGSGKLAKGEGVLSLARGFTQAGCASSIVTQWSVDDCTTSDIMIDFYQNILNSHNKDQALQQAKLNYLVNADQFSTHPYYWAAFVQSGNANSMTFSSRSYLPMILIALFIFIAGFFIWKRMA